MSGTRYVLRRRNGFALFRCLLCTTGVNSRLLLFFSDKIDDSHFSEDNLNNNNKKEEKLHINPTAVDGENSIGWWFIYTSRNFKYYTRHYWRRVSTNNRSLSSISATLLPYNGWVSMENGLYASKRSPSKRPKGIRSAAATISPEFWQWYNTASGTASTLMLHGRTRLIRIVFSARLGQFWFFRRPKHAFLPRERQRLRRRVTTMKW